ncbi:MAG TPA: hypothetical protein VKK31_30665 [Thermoanaerobaculia bacterium]|nr:hypothetical protein [Thermoanaerobaculia bacterium]
MLNLAGSSYDYGNVLFAVLQECEHNRRALLPNEAAARLQEIARTKLAEIRESYEECGGGEAYWQELEREVLETVLPQYVPAVVEQNRLEKSNYDLWRQGEPAARIAFGLLGLLIGALIIAAPWIPIFEDAFAFVLAAAGFLYPEIKKTVFDSRHARLLNRLIGQAEKYQKDQRLHYVSEAKLAAELEAVGKTPAPLRKKKGETKPPDTPRQRDRAS